MARGEPRKRVTIHDVAREAGVSLATVSNALSGKDVVREDTRRLIEATAARLGYRVSAVARALRTQRTHTIGVLLADVANPSSPDFVRGIEDVASAGRYTLLLCNNDGDETRQLMQMRSLIDRQVDGMVLISQHCESASIRALLDHSGVPFVLIQRRSEKYPEDAFIGADSREGMTGAIKHLIALGHRRIAHICGPSTSSAAAERVAVFRDLVMQFGLDDDADLIVASDYSTEAGQAAANRLLDLDVPPTAVMASNDMNALGVLNTAALRGVDVPGALSVVGYDDIALARLAQIALTTIRLPKREMGAAAARLLLANIENRGCRGGRSEMFSTCFVPRCTTGPAPVSL